MLLIIFKMAKKEHPGNHRLASLTSISRKGMELLISETISRHMKDKKVTRSSHHGFSKQMSCFANLINFYNKMTDFIDTGRSVNIVYLDFRKAFIDPHRKAVKVWAVRYTGNWLNSQTQRMVISGTKSGWRPDLRECTPGSILGPVLFNISIYDQHDGADHTLSRFAGRSHLMLFIKGKCQILHLGKNKPRHQYMQRAAQLESSLAEKNLGIPVDTKLNMSQQHALTASCRS